MTHIDKDTKNTSLPTKLSLKLLPERRFLKAPIIGFNSFILIKMPLLFKETPDKQRDESETKMNSAKSGMAPEVRVKSRRAAVLVCLFEGDGGDLRVILTQRCSRISYPGEVSLPGGKVDEGDSNDSETALREAKEEIGLDPSLVKVVRVLDPYMTKRLVSVTPVIGILSDKQAFKPLPNSDEVEIIFDVPLDMFLKNEKQRSEEREWMGDKYLLHFFDYETGNKKFTIWGLTSWILIQVASIVYQRAPNFVQQIPNYQVRSLLAAETKSN